MSNTMLLLLHVFDGCAAFILIDCLSRPYPQFHIVPSTDIQDSPSRTSRPEAAMSILVVTRDIFSQPAALNCVVQSLVHDFAIHTVCVEGVALAQLLMADVTMEFALSLLLYLN
ncbi:hypothetical protein BD769DRAFT_1668980 [Suillus cothurnatus]|nr:hypothetical protein BD769DRAFT_1668980 [Suillus cothurnatus]